MTEKRKVTHCASKIVSESTRQWKKKIRKSIQWRERTCQRAFVEVQHVTNTLRKCQPNSSCFFLDPQILIQFFKNSWFVSKQEERRETKWRTLKFAADREQIGKIILSIHVVFALMSHVIIKTTVRMFLVKMSSFGLWLKCRKQNSGQQNLDFDHLKMTNIFQINFLTQLRSASQ